MVYGILMAYLWCFLEVNEKADQILNAGRDLVGQVSDAIESVRLFLLLVWNQLVVWLGLDITSQTGPNRISQRTLQCTMTFVIL